MITVVIPAHNAAATIDRCLASVLASAAVERVLVVLDACEDDTSARVASWVERDCRVSSEAVQFRSAARTRNHGLAKASSGWVAFLDSDDYWLNDVGEEFLRHLSHAEAAPHLMAANHRVLPSGRFPLGTTGRNSISLDEYVRSGLPYINSSTVCLNASAISALRLFPEGQRLGEDIVAWCRLLKQADCAMVWSAEVAIDRTRPTAAWGELNAPEMNQLHAFLREDIGPEQAGVIIERRIGSLLTLNLARRRWVECARFVAQVDLGLRRCVGSMLRHATRRVLARLNAPLRLES